MGKSFKDKEKYKIKSQEDYQRTNKKPKKFKSEKEILMELYNKE
jgi:hypothetical protein